MIEQVIVKALVNLIISIDLSDEETVDSNFASSAFEDVMATLDELSEGERDGVLGIVQSLAEGESSTQRRQALLEFPENYGLVDEEE